MTVATEDGFNRRKREFFVFPDVSRSTVRMAINIGLREIVSLE